MNRFRQLFLLLGFLLAFPVMGQEPDPSVAGYVADIELQTEEDLIELLSRAEVLFLDGVLSQDGGATLTLVLHGPVLRSLMRDSYRGSKRMVDQAATLSALGVVRIQACRSWMGSNGLQEAGLQPFVGVVSYGPDEVGRLIRDEGYIVF